MPTAISGVHRPIMRIGTSAVSYTAGLWVTKCSSGLVRNTPSSRPTTPKINKPSRTDTQPKRAAFSGCPAPSDWLTSVAVEVPKARQAVNVSLRMPTIIVVAAPLTASATTAGTRRVQHHRV